ncbi:MAG: hypothetical protein PF501_18890 [Salinisphaera sp.]|jgi:hypothetical protein|nr:hypothetical protein [Salinisphaera sp.]
MEIQHAPRHGVGTEKIPQHQIKAPLPPLLTEDVTLLALRFDGLRPMVGYRTGIVFRILWLDHNFELYNH